MRYLLLLVLLSGCSFTRCPSDLVVCRAEVDACRADYAHLTDKKLLARKCVPGGL